MECPSCNRKGLVKEGFYANTRCLNGLTTYCKECLKARARRYDKANADNLRTRVSRWRDKNKDTNLLRQKGYSKALREKSLTEKAKHLRINKELIKSGGKKCHSCLQVKEITEFYGIHGKCKQCLNLQRKKAHPAKIKRNPALIKLNNLIATNIRQSLHNNGTKNKRKWEDLTGYTVHELKLHLEKLFLKGMSWDNHGEWHIDHKIPVSAFNFTTPEDLDFKRCWDINNLQPLWKKDNISKSNKLKKPFQPCLRIQP